MKLLTEEHPIVLDEGSDQSNDFNDLFLLPAEDNTSEGLQALLVCLLPTSRVDVE